MNQILQHIRRRLKKPALLIVNIYIMVMGCIGALVSIIKYGSLVWFVLFLGVAAAEVVRFLLPPE